MDEIIVSCAGCGKRYKGLPGPRKFKCAACQNLLTYPDSPHASSPAKLVCSFCWKDNNFDEGIAHCAHCGQKVSAKFGGKAAYPASASARMLVAVPDEPAVQDKTDLVEKIALLELELQAMQKAKSESDAKIAELLNMMVNAQTAQATMRMEWDRAVSDATQSRAESDRARAELVQARAEMAQARAEMDHFRESAAASLGPLGHEFNLAMTEMMGQAEQMLAHARQTQEQANTRMEELAGISATLSENFSSLRQQFCERIAVVLGAEATADAAAPAENDAG
jgi:hypothetical protein